ncbi:MAG: hypothetical protein Q4Q58_06850 [Thermoplasmata archaeon]|nr:hypothetical protein [Thermoplasmata archaeon]
MTVYEREDEVARILRTCKGKSKRYLSDEQLDEYRKNIFKVLGKEDAYYPLERETEPKKRKIAYELLETVRYRGGATNRASGPSP